MIRLFLSAMVVLSVCGAHAVPSASDTPFIQETHEAIPMPTDAGTHDVRAVLVDGDGMVWIATASGVFRRDANGDTWHAAMADEDAGPTFDLAVDREGTVWAAAWNGLYRKDGTRLVRIEGVPGPVGTVCASAEGVACAGPAGLRLVVDGACTRPPINTARSFRALAVAPDGALWMATENGLYRWLGKDFHCYRSPDEILTAASQDVVVTPDGTVWTGGLGGITRIRRGEAPRFLTPHDGLPNAHVQSLEVGPAGRLWVGTQLGVARYDGQSWSLRHSRRWLVNDDVRDIAFDAEGNAWIATADGVSVIRRKTMTLAEKAKYFESVCTARHVRKPWLVEHCRLREPGDVSTWEPCDDDNDGQYTAMYLAMESFRYAATKDEQARRNAKEAFDALCFLQEVTGTKGFVARTVIPSTWTRMHDPNRTYTAREWAEIRVDNPREKRVENMWRPSADGKWLWKGDTSSDEITGHFYGYLIYHDLVAGAEERRAVADHVRNIMDYIIEGGYVLKDTDGARTQWGVWAPERLNRDPDWAAERGVNSVELLSYLKATHHVTGDARYQREYERLIRDHGYAENARRAKTYELMWRTHIDDELLALAYPALLRYEEDQDLKAIYRESLDHWYLGTSRDESPYFNFTYAALAGGEAHLADSMRFLRDAPLDLVNWRIDNTQREDVQCVRRPEIEFIQTSRLLPVSERAAVRWDKNPWQAAAGDGGHTEWTPVYWLLPYWMGRHYGYIQSPG